MPRRRGTLVFALLGALLTLRSQVVLARDAVLEPSSDWTLTEAPQSCAVSREFEKDGRKVVLQLENHTLGPLLKIAVMTDDYRVAKSKLARAHLSTGFLPGKERDWYARPATLPDGREGITYNYSFAFELDESDLQAASDGEGADENRLQKVSEIARQRELEVDRLFIGNAFSRDLVLHTGSMRAPMVVLRICLAGLARGYGIDWKRLDGAKQRAQPADIKGFVERIQASFPPEEEGRGTGAFFDIIVTVEPTGVADACEVYGPRPAPAFVEAACNVVYLERFAPALDAQGEPIRGVFSTGITYIGSNLPPRHSRGDDTYRPNLEPQVTGGEHSVPPN